ncbi:hypothetical protein [Lysobacter sp. Root690]|uniref:hypothetical protein n=1 Tax=Lysobacter sp. Root690 TaxID=1736588 RepID=UPI00138F5C7E|nr:hypothetical protein [Lysobacter sp. Root690]
MWRSLLAMRSGSADHAASREAGDGLRGFAMAVHGRADADVIEATTTLKAAKTIHAMR